MKCLADQEVEEYTLVGEGENDPFSNRILTTSPIGQGLIGSKVGDSVEIAVPRGTIRFKVLEISVAEI